MQELGINLETYVEAVAHHYNLESEGYDEVYTHPIQKAEDAVVMSIIGEHVQNGQVVLDIGCGTGLPLTYLDIPNYKGIDISSGMITQARRDHPGKQFEVGDMHKLPYPDEIVDTVISLFGPFSYSLEPEKVVKEIERVLKPGGKAIIMPYTMRVQHGLDMGGYSTANATDVPKKYYDSQQLYDLFQSFVDIQVIGINYFGNSVMVYDEAMGTSFTPEEYESLLSHEVSCSDNMPDIRYARHAMVICQKPSMTKGDIYTL